MKSSSDTPEIEPKRPFSCHEGVSLRVSITAIHHILSALPRTKLLIFSVFCTPSARFLIPWWGNTFTKA